MTTKCGGSECGPYASPVERLPVLHMNAERYGKSSERGLRFKVVILGPETAWSWPV